MGASETCSDFLKNNLTKLIYLSHALILTLMPIVKVIIFIFPKGQGGLLFSPFCPEFFKPQKRGSKAGVFARRRSNGNRERFSDKKIGTVAVCSDAYPLETL